MLDKIVPPASHHVRLIPETVAPVREEDKIKVLVGCDQFVYYKEGVVQRHIGVQGAVGQ